MQGHKKLLEKDSECFQSLHYTFRKAWLSGLEGCLALFVYLCSLVHIFTGTTTQCSSTQ